VSGDATSSGRLAIAVGPYVDGRSRQTVGILEGKKKEVCAACLFADQPKATGASRPLQARSLIGFVDDDSSDMPPLTMSRPTLGPDQRVKIYRNMRCCPHCASAATAFGHGGNRPGPPNNAQVERSDAWPSQRIGGLFGRALGSASATCSDDAISITLG